MANTTGPPRRVLNVLTLTMINVAAIATLRDLPAMAVYGLSSVFYCVVVAVVFLIPISLVSAELATGWPQRGSVFLHTALLLGGFVVMSAPPLLTYAVRKPAWNREKEATPVDK